MKTIDVVLQANNSTGEQKLWLSHDDGDYWFTLCGDYRGEKIQIDFNDMGREGLEELKAMIDVVLEST